MFSHLRNEIDGRNIDFNAIIDADYKKSLMYVKEEKKKQQESTAITIDCFLMHMPIK